MWRAFFKYMYTPNNRMDSDVKRKYLAIVYAFVSWQACTVAFYYVWKERAPKDRVELIKKIKESHNLGNTSATLNIKGLSSMTYVEVTDDTAKDSKLQGV